MRSNKDFSIAFKGLKIGMHQFDFEITNQFFEDFEHSPVKAGKLNVELDFYKRLDHFQLDFDIEGTINTSCDRCTAMIDLPIYKSASYIVKFDDVMDDDDQVVYIKVNAQLLNVAEMIYELVVLGMPMIKVYDCEDDDPRPCNMNVLDVLNQKQTESDDDKKNPLWDQLSELNFNDN